MTSVFFGNIIFIVIEYRVILEQQARRQEGPFLYSFHTKHKQFSVYYYVAYMVLSNQTSVSRSKDVACVDNGCTS